MKGFIVIFILTLILYFLLYPSFRGIEGLLILLIFTNGLTILPIVILFSFLISVFDIIIIHKHGKKIQAKVVNIKHIWTHKGISKSYKLFLEFEYKSNILIKSLSKSSLLDNLKFTHKYFGKKYFVYYTDKLPNRIFKSPLIKEYFFIISLFIFILIYIPFILHSLYDIYVYVKL